MKRTRGIPAAALLAGGFTSAHRGGHPCHATGGRHHRCDSVAHFVRAHYDAQGNGAPVGPGTRTETFWWCEAAVREAHALGIGVESA